MKVQVIITTKAVALTTLELARIGSKVRTIAENPMRQNEIRPRISKVFNS